MKKRLNKTEKRYVAALKEHVTNPPDRCDKSYAERLAAKFEIQVKPLRSLLNMLAQEGL